MTPWHQSEITFSIHLNISHITWFKIHFIRRCKMETISPHQCFAVSFHEEALTLNGLSYLKVLEAKPQAIFISPCASVVYLQCCTLSQIKKTVAKTLNACCKYQFAVFQSPLVSESCICNVYMCNISGCGTLYSSVEMLYYTNMNMPQEKFHMLCYETCAMLAS